MPVDLIASSLNGLDSESGLNGLDSESGLNGLDSGSGLNGLGSETGLVSSLHGRPRPTCVFSSMLS